MTVSCWKTNRPIALTFSLVYRCLPLFSQGCLKSIRQITNVWNKQQNTELKWNHELMNQLCVAVVYCVLVSLLLSSHAAVICSSCDLVCVFCLCRIIACFYPSVSPLTSPERWHLFSTICNVLSSCLCKLGPNAQQRPSFLWISKKRWT